jgi:hypothetical protein
MLGTPNGGVPCVDVFVGKFDLFKKELKAARELTNDEMLNFNRYVVNTGGAKLSALAGNPVPVVCGGLEWNDGFVTVKSAHYGVSDIGQSNDLHYQLVDGKNFGNFVKPHLVTGPKKTYPLPVKNDPTDWKRWQVANRDYDVNNGSGLARNEFVPRLENLTDAVFDSFASGGGPNALDVDPVAGFPVRLNESFSKELKIAPKQSVTAEMPVEAASNFGVTFFANPSVTVSLINEKGIVVTKSVSSSAFANSMFRSLFAYRPVGAGTWKLKIENTSDMEQMFVGYGWTAEGVDPNQLPQVK